MNLQLFILWVVSGYAIFEVIVVGMFVFLRNKKTNEIVQLTCVATQEAFSSDNPNWSRSSLT